MENDNYQSATLMILGGLGVRPHGDDNAFSLAKMPYLKNLLENYPAGVLSVSGSSRQERYGLLGGNPPFTGALSLAGYSQTYIAETERAAFVFENMRQRKELLLGEEEILVPSLPGEYEKQPLGRIKEIEKATLKAIKQKREVVIADLSVVDLMMQFGDMEKINKTITRTDEALRKICESEINRGGVVVIVSAGGNAERWRDLSLDIEDRGLTLNPVPIIIAAHSLFGRSLSAQDIQDGDLSTLSPIGTLSDVGPTILSLLGVKIPSGSSGSPLISN